MYLAPKSFTKTSGKLTSPEFAQQALSALVNGITFMLSTAILHIVIERGGLKLFSAAFLCFVMYWLATSRKVVKGLQYCLTIVAGLALFERNLILAHFLFTGISVLSIWYTKYKLQHKSTSL